MNRLMRNRRDVYVCNQQEDKGRINFSKPILYKLNYQPLSSAGEIVASGNDYINRLVVYTSIENAKKIHNFDRCYVFTLPPNTYDAFCQDADFYVDGEPLLYLNEAVFYLQRMVGEADE